MFRRISLQLEHDVSMCIDGQVLWISDEPSVDTFVATSSRRGAMIVLLRAGQPLELICVFSGWLEFGGLLISKELN